MLKRLCFLFILLCIASTDAQANNSLWMKLYQPGHFAIMRHGIAPGTGDPDNFKIDDCSTQRNLNAEGRIQSQKIGANARKNGISHAYVYSSQWCRCLDTATQLDLGKVTPLPALNSFFQRYEDKDKHISALRSFLRENLERTSPIILVTHQVTISALTGQFTRQGETIIFKYLDGGAVEVVGTIPPG